MGSFHPSLINDLYKLANAYEATEDYGKAVKQYRRALKIVQHHQPNPKKEGELLGYIGAIKFHTTSISNEQKLARELELYRRIYGSQHIHIAVTLHQLAKRYQLGGNYKKAEQSIKQALISAKQISGREHPYIALILDDYAEILKQTNREERAINLNKQATAIRSAHPEKKLVKLYNP